MGFKRKVLVAPWSCPRSIALWVSWKLAPRSRRLQAFLVQLSLVLASTVDKQHGQKRSGMGGCAVRRRAQVEGLWQTPLLSTTLLFWEGWSPLNWLFFRKTPFNCDCFQLLSHGALCWYYCELETKYLKKSNKDLFVFSLFIISLSPFVSIT